MKRFFLCTFAALILTAGPVHAVSACDKSNTVRAAFEPRLAFEQARATRVGGVEWSKDVRVGFERIAQKPGDCPQLFASYKRYLERIIRQNDSFENAHGARGIFRKW